MKNYSFAFDIWWVCREHDIEYICKTHKGPNELMGANGNIEKVLVGVLLEILMESSIQKLHQFHQNWVLKLFKLFNGKFCSKYHHFL